MDEFIWYRRLIRNQGWPKLVMNLMQAEWIPSRAGNSRLGRRFNDTLMETLISTYMLDAYLLDIETGNLFTYDPLKSRNLNKLNKDLIEIGTCNENEIRNVKKISQPMKFNFWVNSSIQVLYHDIGVYSRKDLQKGPLGLEIDIFREIADHLKLGINFIWTGEKQNKHCQFFIGTNVAILAGGMDYTVSYVQDFMKLYIPRKQKWPRWRYILNVFNLQIWTSWIISFTLIFLVWIFSEFFMNNQKNNFIYATRKVFHKVLGLLTGTDMNGLNTFNGSQQIILWFINLMIFGFSTLFNTRLTYLLNGISYEDGVKTIHGLMENEYYIFSSSTNALKVASYLFEGYPKELFVHCGYLDICMNRIMTEKDFVLFYPARQVQNDEKLHPYLEEFDGESYLTFFVVAYSFLGSPLLETFNQCLLYSIEGGLADRIIKNYEGNESFGFNPTSEEKQPLNIEHVIAPSVFLISGLILASFVLCLELKIARKKSFLNLHSKNNLLINSSHGIIHQLLH